MKEETHIRTNSFKAWMLASRPKTLTAAAVPVMVGLSLAYSDVGAAKFNVIPAILCVLFAFIMQIDANFINDYFDYDKHTQQNKKPHDLIIPFPKTKCYTKGPD